jgi:6-pyruvoyltetrahydropterin/6-carboxytetrahydropterin synthase
MPFVVDVCVVFRARQGLPSPVRAAAGQQRLVPGEDVEVALRAGVGFEDDDLTERGWFFDTDAFSVRLAAWADLLGDGPWTNRFPFRPTFELVARHLYSELVTAVPGLPVCSPYVPVPLQTTELA